MIPFTRSDRVGGLLQRALSDILQKGVKDPRLKMVTITGVKMSQDLRHARIYYAVSMGKKSAREVEKGFKSALGYLKRTLAGRLGLRYMPDLNFFYDESVDYGAHIDEVLKTVNTNSINTNNESDN